jgi:hypothetical protein
LLDSYSIHPVLQDRTRDTLDGEKWNNSIRIAAKIIDLSRSNAENADIERRLLPHAERCIFLWNEGKMLDSADTFTRLSQIFKDHNR